jgi:hypothetical protein
VSPPAPEGAPPDAEPSPLTPDQLAAVAELWARTGRELRVRFTGRSMEPTIASGAEVRLVCGEGGALGDVVAVRETGGVIVHRVVAGGGKGGWLLTRGDARWLPDAPAVGAGALIGRVTAVYEGAAPAPLGPRHDSPGQRLALAPLLAVLGISPRAGLAMVRGLVRLRRLALRALTPRRRRLRAAARPRR